MDGKKLDIRPLTGLDEREPQPMQAASKLVNYTVDPRTRGWDNRLGYEKYLVGSTNIYTPFNTTNRIDSLYVWPRHNGAQEWVVFEDSGTLYYLQDYASPDVIRSIATGRNIPTASEAPTTYTPYGKYLLIANGYDAPLRYGAWPVRENSPFVPVWPWGWEAAPPPPTPWGIDVSPDTTTTAGQAVGIWASSEEGGLGSATGNATNAYRWKVAYLSNANGTSPISQPSTVVTWTTPNAGTWANRRFVAAVYIPVGPSGTIGRYIYRTENMSDGATGTENYKLVAFIPNNTETIYYDYTPDARLGSAAPGDADSVAFPSPRCRYSAQFKGCVFVDGGADNGTRLYWSNPGKPDQFAALDYYDVGTRAGGEITGFYAHYNFMLVFRESAVDMVRGEYGAFEVRPLMVGTGTRAQGTARTIPDLGVVFLATDGVYLVSGNVDAGGVVNVKKISEQVDADIKRMNLDVMARATAEYSQKWREYQVWYAADGSDRPSLGLVLHLDKGGTWSTRTDMPVGCLAVNTNGEFIFGHHTGWGSVSNTPAGLFVITRRHSCGHTLVSSGGEQPTYTTVYGPACSSTYRSAWLDFGDAAEKKGIVYLDLYLCSMGNDPVTVTVYKDHSTAGVNLPAILLQRADHPDQYVYGVGVVGTATWEDAKPSVFRVAVDAGLARSLGQPGGACSHFAWEIVTTADMVVLGYSVTYTVKGQAIVPAKRST